MFSKEDLRLDLLAKVLIMVADLLVTYFYGLEQQPSCVVLLGRDAWPLFPLLIQKGLPVRYFHWSRLQKKDTSRYPSLTSTCERWMLEVPKGPLVVDSGVEGSILDCIRDVDPSMQGCLIYSTRHWPQISPGAVWNKAVTLLEALPKITGRCSGYRPDGTAILNPWDRDEDEVVLPYEEVQELNQELLGLMGIPDAQLDYWDTFTGSAPVDRGEDELGVSIVDGVIHYRVA